MSCFFTYPLCFKPLTSAAMEKEKVRGKNEHFSKFEKLINTNKFHTWFFSHISIKFQQNLLTQFKKRFQGHGFFLSSGFASLICFLSTICLFLIVTSQLLQFFVGQATHCRSHKSVEQQKTQENTHHIIHSCVCQSLSHVQLCESLDCGPPGFSVHGILQARILPPGDLPDSGLEPWSPALQADSLLFELPWSSYLSY